PQGAGRQAVRRDSDGIALGVEVERVEDGAAVHGDVRRRRATQGERVIVRAAEDAGAARGVERRAGERGRAAEAGVGVAEVHGQGDGPGRLHQRAGAERQVVAGLQDDVAAGGAHRDAGVDGQVVARQGAVGGGGGQGAGAGGVHGEGDRAGGGQGRG